MMLGRIVLVSLPIAALLTGCHRAEDASAPATTLAPAELLAVVPGPGASLEIGAAARVAVSEGVVYVTDRIERRVLAFGSDGALLGGWGSEGSGPGEFLSPDRIVPAPNGSIWVADIGLSRASQYSPAGQLLGTVAAPLPAFSIAGDEVIVLGGPAGTLATFIGSGGMRRLTGSFENTPTLPQLLHFIPLHAGARGLFLFDNVGGALMKVRAEGQDARLEPRAVPGWLVALARAKQEQRQQALAHLRTVSIIPQFQDVKVDGDDLWFSAGWAELLGARIPLTDEFVGGIAVVPTQGQEFVGMVDSAMVDDSTLAALYSTELRLYRLRPAATPNW
jgi:hypothetical protein